MSLVNNIRSYILEDTFKAIIMDNMIDIINYDSIIDVSDKSVKIRHLTGVLEVIGRNLSINKLLDDEVLITGSISTIEIR